LNITIIVLGSPYKTTISLEDLSDHIIDESMFIVNSFLLIVFLEIFFIDLLEDVFKSAIIFLENSVLGRKFKGISSVKSELKTSSGEGGD
jgi:hypothetical protein